MKQLLIACLALSACSHYEENLGQTRDVSARWAITVGTRQEEAAQGVAIDSLGDVVAVGYRQTAEVQRAGFVTKRVASDGSERWTRVFQPRSADSYADTKAVAIAPGDGILAAGIFLGRVDFAGITLDASDSTPAYVSPAFVAKLSSAGDVVWVAAIPHVFVQAIETGADGRIYVTGGFVGPLSVAGTTLSSSSAGMGGMVIALDRDGVALWGRVFTTNQASAGGAVGEGIAIAPNGDVLVSGEFAGAYEFGGAVHQLPAGRQYASFLTRFRANGLYLASSVVPQSRDQEGRTRVSVDPAGATVVYTARDPGSEPSLAPAVHVLDDAQHEVWSGNLRGPIAFTDDGALFTAQWMDHRSAGKGTLELATVDATGFTWSTTLGTRIVAAARYSGLRAAAAGPDGGVALVGDLTGTIGIAGVELALTGGQLDVDALVIMIDP